MLKNAFHARGGNFTRSYFVCPFLYWQLDYVVIRFYRALHFPLPLFPATERDLLGCQGRSSWAMAEQVTLCGFTGNNLSRKMRDLFLLLSGWGLFALHISYGSGKRSESDLALLEVRRQSPVTIHSVVSVASPCNSIGRASFPGSFFERSLSETPRLA